jgi:hypothetical protein
MWRWLFKYAHLVFGWRGQHLGTDNVNIQFGVADRFTCCVRHHGERRNAEARREHHHRDTWRGFEHQSVRGERVGRPLALADAVRSVSGD